MCVSRWRGGRNFFLVHRFVFWCRCFWRSGSPIFLVPFSVARCHCEKFGAISFCAVARRNFWCHFFWRGAIAKNLGHQIGARALARNLSYLGCCELKCERRVNASRISGVVVARRGVVAGSRHSAFVIRHSSQAWADAADVNGGAQTATARMPNHACRMPVLVVQVLCRGRKKP